MTVSCPIYTRKFSFNQDCSTRRQNPEKYMGKFRKSLNKLDGLNTRKLTLRRRDLLGLLLHELIGSPDELWLRRL
jgi:hypothetical protein